MALIKRRSSDLPTFSSWLGDFFADDFNLVDKVATVPAVNIKERKKDFVIEMDVPGMDKNDFDIEIDNNVLTISAKKQEEKQEDGEKYTKREFYYNEFKRVFTLPETVDTEKIEANYKNGLLKVLIEKKPEAQTKPLKKIAIK